MPHFQYPFIPWWTQVVSMPWLLWIMLLWTWECIQLLRYFFQFLWFYGQEWECWITQLHHSTFPSTVYKCSSFSISSPTFAVFFLQLCMRITDSLTLWFIIKYLIFVSISSAELLKALEFPVLSDKDVFCYVNELIRKVPKGWELVARRSNFE